MPNIKQQKKRVRVAGEERMENLRFRSTAKTLAKRLQAAVDDGDEEKIAETHRRLISWLDRAVVRLADLDLALKGNSRLAGELELERAVVEVTAPPR